MAKQEDVFKKVISHAKEYGFIFPSSEIYDGLSAIYDYGQNGIELKNNIKQWETKIKTYPTGKQTFRLRRQRQAM